MGAKYRAMLRENLLVPGKDYSGGLPSNRKVTLKIQPELNGLGSPVTMTQS